MAAAACAGEPASPPEMTNAERGQIQAEVLDWADQWLEAGTNLDGVGVSALFDQADGHFSNGATYLPNWQRFRDVSLELYAGWEAWEAEWGTRRVDVLSEEAALFVGEAIGMIREEGGTEMDNRAVFSFVVRKVDGEWKGLFGHVTGASSPRS
jgi:hypothetical protein